MRKTIKHRIKVLALGVVFVFPCIAIRLFYVQIVFNSYYSEEASRNLDRYRETTPRRGAIYDRNGNILVKTAPAHHVFFIPSKVTDTTIANLSKLLELPRQELQEKIENQKAICQAEVNRQMEKHTQLPPKKRAQIQKNIAKDFFGRKYPLCKNLSSEKAMLLKYETKHWRFINDQQADIGSIIPGIELGDTPYRQYPWDDLLIQVLGNIGLVAASDLDRDKDYRPSDFLGKRGVELMLEDKLRGRRGCLVDSREGDIFAELPTDGREVVLTIDAKAQLVAEQSLDAILRQNPTALGGAAVIVEIATGDILVLATAPRYENAQLSSSYKELVDDPKRPLDNRAIRNAYPPAPGSVFKVLVSIYALEQGVIDENTQFYCRGYLHNPQSFRCTHTHHEVKLIEAVAGSCNVYFYKVGEMLGMKQLAECANIFGFGERVQLGLPEEYPGQVPSRARNSSIGESRMMGIGQIMTATPVQVAYAMAMLANKGAMPPVRLIKKVRMPRQHLRQTGLGNQLAKHGNPEIRLVADNDPAAEPKHEVRKYWPMQQKNWLLVKKGMQNVVDSSEGTAYEIKASLNGIKIASKTGTSQNSRGENHAWFAGFAPLDDPKYAFAVFVEHGGYGGKTAAPVAAEILKELCLRKELPPNPAVASDEQQDNDEDESAS